MTDLQAILDKGGPWEQARIIGDQLLIQGDCREVMAVLPRVDAVVTDPPYGVGLTAKQHKWFVAKGDGYASFDDTPENVSAIVLPAIQMAILAARSVIVTPGTKCAWLYPQPDDIGAIFNSSGTGSGSWGFKCSTPILFYGKCPYLASNMGRRANSWQQPATDFADKSDHPCPKPLGMMQWLVVRASLPSETVLDPFMGSGTTLVACQRLGRQGIGIELDESYFKIAAKRVEEACRQPDLFIKAPKPAAPAQESFFDE